MDLMPHFAASSPKRPSHVAKEAAIIGLGTPTSRTPKRRHSAPGAGEDGSDIRLDGDDDGED